MKRIMLTVAYDGTNYSGSQLQKNAPSVEGVLNSALGHLTSENIRVTGASRTDAGVHAMGNVWTFDTASTIPPEKITFALNPLLPADIRVQDSVEVQGDFHPRHATCVKTYEYRIWNGRVMNPLRRQDTAFCCRPLDVEKMQQAAESLVGRHDFRSFCSPHTTAETTVREILSIEIYRDRQEERLITIRVRGYGFLYNMVRIIAGTLMEIGTGKAPVKKTAEALSCLDRQAAGPTAEPRGLVLKKIRYEDTLIRFFPDLESALRAAKKDQPESRRRFLVLTYPGENAEMRRLSEEKRAFGHDHGFTSIEQFVDVAEDVPEAVEELTTERTGRSTPAIVVDSLSQLSRNEWERFDRAAISQEEVEEKIRQDLKALATYGPVFAVR